LCLLVDWIKHLLGKILVDLLSYPKVKWDKNLSQKNYPLEKIKTIIAGERGGEHTYKIY
jgi:hypothetical protein